MDEEDLLLHFVDALQHCAKQELHRRDLKALDDAIVAAEYLSE